MEEPKIDFKLKEVIKVKCNHLNVYLDYEAEITGYTKANNHKAYEMDLWLQGGGADYKPPHHHKLKAKSLNLLFLNLNKFLGKHRYYVTDYSPPEYYFKK